MSFLMQPLSVDVDSAFLSILLKFYNAYAASAEAASLTDGTSDTDTEAKETVLEMSKLPEDERCYGWKNNLR